MKRLVVLDSNKNIIHKYKVDDDVYVNDAFVSSLGHKINECHWICAKKIDIFEHLGIICNKNLKLCK